MPSRAIDQYCGAAGRMWPSWATLSNRIRLPLPQRPMLKSDPQARRDDAPSRSRAAPSRLRPAPRLAGAACLSRERQIRARNSPVPRRPYAPSRSHFPSLALPHVRISQLTQCVSMRDPVSDVPSRPRLGAFRSPSKYGIAPRRRRRERLPIERRSDTISQSYSICSRGEGGRAHN